VVHAGTWCTAELTVTGPRAGILPDMSDDGEKSLHFKTRGRLNSEYPVESTFKIVGIA
jgi:hypothetical protein